MKTDNRGATLLEVIVATVLLGIMVVAGMNAFGVARQTNNISNKYLQAENLATTILEESANLDFDYLSSGADSWYLDPSSTECVIHIPDNMSTDNSWSISSEDNSGNGEVDSITLEINDVKGNKASYDVTLQLNDIPYDSNYNKKQFVKLDTISSDNTCIIDSVGATNIYNTDGDNFIYEYTTDGLKYFIQNSSYSYDKQAVDHFSELNSSYITRKWREECERIDAFNEAHKDEGIWIDYPILGEGAYTLATDEEIQAHLLKTTEVDVFTNSLFTFVSAKLSYELVQNTGSGWVSIIEDENYMLNPLRVKDYTVTSSKKYIDLKNLYLMYVELSDKWYNEKIVVNNGTNAFNSAEFNLYLIKQPFNSEGDLIQVIGYVDPENTVPFYRATDTEIRSLSPSKGITIYTNTDMNSSSAGIADTVKVLFTDKVHLLHDKYTRLFDASITVRDKTGEALFSSKRTNILK